MTSEILLNLIDDIALAAAPAVRTNDAPLASNDQPSPAMLAWCRKHHDVLVLQSGVIITANPGSRDVQNCKIAMANKGIPVGAVKQVSHAELKAMFSNAHVVEGTLATHEITPMSNQQRLSVLVAQARLMGASAVHLEVRADATRIRMRQHGELYLHDTWSANVGRELAIMLCQQESDLTTPKNVATSLQIDGQKIRLRVASMPAQGGFDIVLRVLAADSEPSTTLAALGYQPAQIKLLNKAMRMPSGAILIAGPAGCGKTTTVATCLSLVSPQRKIYSIEESLDKIVTSATQIPVNAEHDERAFATLGRAVLRMDPDVIVLGEMFDAATAQVLLRATMMGRLVLSTLHTTSAIAIVPRLLEMGISAKVLGDKNVLLALICQRLLPTLCQHCAVPLSQVDTYEPYLLRWTRVFKNKMADLKARQGCDACQHTGLHGRTVIAEMIWMDEPGRVYIQHGDMIGWEQHLHDLGFVSHQQQAIELTAAGICDPLDVERIIGEMHHGSYQIQAVGK